MNEENNVTNITNQTVEIMDHEKLVRLLDFFWTEEWKAEEQEEITGKNDLSKQMTLFCT